MKVVLIGVGQAGGKVTQALAEFDYDMGFDAVKGALAVNTAEADLQNLDIDTALIGQDRVKGHGVGGDNELGAEIMQENAIEVMNKLEGRITSQAEAVIVVAGLGGGTGSGGAPALTRELQRIHNIPVYVLGVLPGRDEGGIYQANAGRSLKTCVRESDSLILIDNDAWKAAEDSMEAGFDRINDAIAQRVGLLFAAGEAVEGVGESVVDSSEIINTLKNGGIASVGYAAAPASEDAGENISVITSVTRNALMTSMSLPDATKADAGLLVVAGHPERLARKSVERARKWMEEETDSLEIRGGDFPINSEKIASLVLLGGVERSSRIEEFMARARAASEGMVDDRDSMQGMENEDLNDLM